VFEWDEANVEHIARHGVVPDEVEEVFSDHRRIAVPARDQGGEPRFALVGGTEDGRVLFVVYTIRRDVIRVVTARDAAPATRRRYRRRR
jgi:uncharacterized DUF497 family protein